MLLCWCEVLLCVLLSVLYVASLYIWDTSKGRDHPSTIKKRCISVAVMTVLSPLFVIFTVTPDAFQQYGYPSPGDSPFSLAEVMGLRLTGLLSAVGLPFMLTAIFYTGPIVYWMTHESSAIFLDPRYWARQLTSAVWLRNQVVAPFSEEWTFRACLLPMLLQCMAPTTALFVAPLFFGLAHLHHAVERLRLGIPVLAVALGTVFQCLFTSIFGMYSAYLFMKTGIRWDFCLRKYWRRGDWGCRAPTSHERVFRLEPSPRPVNLFGGRAALIIAVFIAETVVI